MVEKKAPVKSNANVINFTNIPFINSFPKKQETKTVPVASEPTETKNENMCPSSNVEQLTQEVDKKSLDTSPKIVGKTKITNLESLMLLKKTLDMKLK